MKLAAWSLLFTIALPSGIHSQNHRSPAYTGDQLNLINNQLDKWKQPLRYPVVRDVFRDLNFKPDWDQPSPWDAMPDLFKDEAEAVRAGCQCDFLKGVQQKSCLLKLVAGQQAWLFIYDPDSTGRYVKTGVITPQTYYGIASVALVDVFGKGKPKFILIEHQGGSGTGFDEKVHWMLGWREGAFHTVFRETVLSTLGALGEGTTYRMNYKLLKGDKPRIEAEHAFDRVFNTADPSDFHSQWKDWLFWNEARFSFYNDQIQDEKIDISSRANDAFNFRSRIERNRKAILALPPLPQRMWECNAVEQYWQSVDTVSVAERDETPTKAK